MIKSNGINKIRTAIFISGSGSNLKNLINFSLSKKSPIEVIYVLSSNPKARGLDYARKYRIKYQIYNFKNRVNDEKKILEYLKTIE